MNSPTPKEIKALRTKAGLTQRQCAQLLGKTTRAWQYWEAGKRPMPASDFELFKIKTGQAA